MIYNIRPFSVRQPPVTEAKNHFLPSITQMTPPDHAMPTLGTPQHILARIHMTITPFVQQVTVVNRCIKTINTASLSIHTYLLLYSCAKNMFRPQNETEPEAFAKGSCV
jgi:hypothetical protein